MTRDRQRDNDASTWRETKSEVVGTPGKRTLTEKLPAGPLPIQGKQERVARDHGASSTASSSPAQGVAAGAGVAAAGAAGAMVTPTPALTVDASAGPKGGNECVPNNLASTWTVEDRGASWGVNLTAFTTSGTIHVAPWPSLPSTMVTPNTANPVNGGNLNDIPGHNNYWGFAVDAMKSYTTTGASHHWHSYTASYAHEAAHWTKDWMGTCIAALWPAANVDVNAMSIPKASAPDAVAARPLLAAMISTRFATLQAALDAMWAALPDSPGPSAGVGYAAGQAELDKLIHAIEAYAKSKGWVRRGVAQKSH